MNIFINEKPAEITLDTEKTLGDVLSGIEQWIASTGNRIQRISINDRDVPGDELEKVFPLEINEIEKMDVFISSWRELAAEALTDLYETCVLYGNAAFEERSQIIADWKNCSAARFLASDICDLYNLALRTLNGDGLPLSDFTVLIEERLREIADPVKEIAKMESQVRIIADRMGEFPLDMQTGKDRRASETVQLFSGIGEKLFRIFFIYKSEGLLQDTFEIDGLPVRTFIDDFIAALKELSTAYENRDTVLAGDIAEYELAPRLLEIYSALKNITISDLPVLSMPL